MVHQGRRGGFRRVDGPSSRACRTPRAEEVDAGGLKAYFRAPPGRLSELDPDAGGALSADVMKFASGDGFSSRTVDR